ncbi:RNA-directed DNA polymerase-like protein [Cucumis melo var. makuwa]|uniref:RNA-directed DNA polymerase-like protein n=1 Tax=Cucumis melo var. makuwa TaxID=1194695 RepID=A0A5A7UNQ6_CUCMM|nr:RNA-directed DNA polymerase-like protein [Cucumis melo var. makuwa]TYK21192.1 RNA-directed DNA polymerase-like protein [Cucumis melo var. makuwa]
MPVVKKEDNELIPNRTVTRWTICMNYHKLNTPTKKDHFPLLFIDQMLDMLVGKEYYFLLDGYYGYNQIAIASKDQHKTMFTCLYGTLAFCQMPFSLCNALDFLERSVEIFMDEFSVFGNSFKECLCSLEEVLEKCEETRLVLKQREVSLHEECCAIVELMLENVASETCP